MATGDVVNDVQTITAGNFLNYQPAAGVEVKITSVGGTSATTGGVQVNLYDGSIRGAFMHIPTDTGGPLQTSAGGYQNHQGNVNIRINNSRYLSLGAISFNQNVVYSGEQTR